ncbi:MAG: histidine phosphatase family protein [Vicinamibacteria bacterium]
MKLLLVRHAIALDRDTPGVSDHLRPLTEEGIAKFRRTARALGALVTADLVLTSPLLRAKQTAEILARHWPGVAVQEDDALGHGSRARFEDSLTHASDHAVIAAVGHEPFMSEWTANWLGAHESSAFEFKKGGAALIEFRGQPKEGGGRLGFFLAPKTIKDLTD